MSWSKFLAKIPRQQFLVSFNRSSGPGGQNVNKVNTKATIRLPKEKLASADWLDEELRAQIMSPKFIYSTKRGDLIVSSELTRSQPSNLNDCFEKLAKEIAKQAFVPADPSKEAQERWKELAKREDRKRKDLKKRHSAKKMDRKL